MGRAADHSRTIADPSSAKRLLFELQVEQHHHDENYHREVARLSMHQRLNHMALHFAKYTGKVAAESDSCALMRIYVDVFIIALSTANILNIELWESLEKRDQEFPGLLAFGRSLAMGMKDELADHGSLVRDTAIASGRIAAACEKIDHLEAIQFRAEIMGGIARLSGLSLAYISSQGIDPVQAVRHRLDGVKERHKLHHRM